MSIDVKPGNMRQSGKDECCVRKGANSYEALSNRPDTDRHFAHARVVPAKKIVLREESLRPRVLLATIMHFDPAYRILPSSQSNHQNFA